jgi:hypothetical protein
MFSASTVKEMWHGSNIFWVVVCPCLSCVELCFEREFVCCSGGGGGGGVGWFSVVALVAFLWYWLLFFVGIWKGVEWEGGRRRNRKSKIGKNKKNTSGQS